MTAKDKSKELLLKFWIKADIDKVGAYMDKALAKQCAIICVDEIIKVTPSVFVTPDEEVSSVHRQYWEQVKQEINLL